MMQQRAEIKIKGEIVVQIMCKTGLSDGDLATILEDIEQDLRFNVMRDAETLFQ
jgi:hypothetical protein